MAVEDTGLTEQPAGNAVSRWLRERGLGELKLPSGDEDGNRGWVIVLSVLLSFLLWFTVSMRQDYTVTVDLPLQVVNIPDGRALEAEPISNVGIQVRGEGWLLLRLYSAPEPLIVDAAAGSANLVDLVNERLNDLNVIQVSPQQLGIDLGPRISRTIPIRFTGRVVPASNMDTLRQPTLSPDSIVVTGAASLVEALEYWPTEPVVFEDENASFVREIPLSDTLGGLITLSRDMATLSAEIEQFTEIQREVRVIVEDKPASDTEVTLIPDHIRVSFLVPLSQYDTAESSDAIYGVVQYDQIYYDDSTGTVVPSLRVPRHIQVRDVRLETERLEYYVVLR